MILTGHRRMCADCVRVVTGRWYAPLQQRSRVLALWGDAAVARSTWNGILGSVFPFAVTKRSLVEFVAAYLPVRHQLIEQG